MAEQHSRSITDVLQDIVVNIQTIVRAEVRLAKAETTEEIRKATKSAAFLIGGMLAALFTVWLVLLTSLFALAIVIPFWAAALVLLIIMAVITAALLLTGKKRFETVHPVPERTVETMKENAEWLRSQAK